MIDEVLDLLGWEKTEYEVEPSARGADGQTVYLDYLLSHADLKIVVEAKRAGGTFAASEEITAESLNKGECSKLLDEAIQQAVGYARGKGALCCVVTNGGEWIIFPTPKDSRRGIDAVIFGSLRHALIDNWEEFSSLLSREAISLGSFERRFYASTIAPDWRSRAAALSGSWHHRRSVRVGLLVIAALCVMTCGTAWYTFSSRMGVKEAIATLQSSSATGGGAYVANAIEVIRQNDVPLEQQSLGGLPRNVCRSITFE